jgi:hypothetical protein
MKLTTGIASALARGDISDTCWNSASMGGSRPSVTAHWVRADAASQCPGPSRWQPTKSSRATAPKESQNPGETTAQGSMVSTIASAQASTVLALPGRPSQSPSAPTLSMYRVRCAGTWKPASST